MRKWAVWLIGTALLLGSAGISMAATVTTASSGPANVLVVFNEGNSDSQKLAAAYQAVYTIADSNMDGLSCPDSWNVDGHDTIAKSDYFTYLYDPIIAKVDALAAQGVRIDYIVMCRNLPFLVQISSDNSNFLVSADSALMVDDGTPDVLQSSGFFHSTQTFANYKANGSVNSNATGTTAVPFLVSRLDGWNWGQAYALINQAQALRFPNAEAFLNTSAYWNDPKKGDYPYPNTAMVAAAATLTAAGVANQLATEHFTRPTIPLSGYVSWADEDPTFSWGAFDRLPLAPGSLVYLVGPDDAVTLRNQPAHPTQVSPSFGTLIAEGATGGIANTERTIGFEYPEYFLENYLIGGWNLVDSLYSSVGYVGWTEVVLGDPLCTYLGPGFLTPSTDLGMRPSVAVGSTATWGTGSGSSDTGTDTVGTGATVGSTDSWGVGGGGGKSTSHPSW